MASIENGMLVFLVCLFTVIVIVFAVLGYGAINDGQRLLFTGISVFFLVAVAILGLVLAVLWSEESAEQANANNPIPLVKISPIPPKAPEVASPAILPMMASRGMSFHLEGGQSSPIFRVPVGQKAHVSVYGGAVAVYSGGTLKLSCDTRSFSITGTGEGGTQLVACGSNVDVLIDDVSG
jgi:hypothetical protein